MSKFCPNCGSACNDGQAFCPSCGSRLPAQQPPYGQQPLYGQQPPYGQQSPYGQQPPYGPALGMKWFKFIIYFQLFASALVNLIGGIVIFTGSHYGDSQTAELVYTFFSGLKTIDIFYGICMIALAVGDIYVRMQLAGYRAVAPKLYLGILAATVIVGLIYLIAVISLLGDLGRGLDFTADISQLVGSVVMIAVNSIYFKKRAHLFVN